MYGRNAPRGVRGSAALARLRARPRPRGHGSRVLWLARTHIRYPPLGNLPRRFRRSFNFAKRRWSRYTMATHPFVQTEEPCIGLLVGPVDTSANYTPCECWARVTGRGRWHFRGPFQGACQEVTSPPSPPCTLQPPAWYSPPTHCGGGAPIRTRGTPKWGAKNGQGHAGRRSFS
jgi:hypothetical protein